jgi:hypothetical protein
MSWSTLPTELQLSVLEDLAQLDFQNRIGQKPNAPYSTGTSLSKYVAVSEQWQDFFESRIMDTLHVTRHDMKMFAHVFRIERRRKYLRQIALVIRLPDEIPPFRMMEDLKESFIVDLLLESELVGLASLCGLPSISREVKNNIALMETVYALLVQLSRWKTKHVRRGGIGLELLADKQSSWQIIASQLTAFQRPIEFNGENISPVEQQWLIDAAMDNFSLSLDFETEHYQGPALEMPRVGVITSLSIMRRSKRRFGCSIIAELMGDLRALKHLFLEIEPMRSQSAEDWLQDYLSEIVMSGPRRMDRIQIVYLQPHIIHSRLNPDALLIRSLSSNLADRAQCLRHLCISYSIDAFQFFKRAVRGKYPTLRSLTVWSKQRIIERAPSTSHDLLRLIIRALLRIPNMQFLTVYSMGPSSAGLFNYDASGNFSGHESLYHICSSWNWELSHEIRTFVWDSLLQKESREFALRGERLPTAQVKSLIATILGKSEAMGRDDKGVGM